MPKQPCYRQKFTIHGAQGDLKGYLTVDEGPDGLPTSIALSISKDGSMGQGLANAWAEAINLALRSGASLQDVVDTFRGWRFDPCGPVTDSPHVTHAESCLDFVVQELEATYLRERA